MSPFEEYVTNELLDVLCKLTTKPDVLNALNACREGHPLGRGNPFKWRNALGMVRQNTRDFASVDVMFLEKQALAEATGPDKDATINLLRELLWRVLAANIAQCCTAPHPRIDLVYDISQALASTSIAMRPGPVVSFRADR